MREILTEVGAGASGFLGWWGRELADMVPASVRRRLAADDSRVRVDLADDGIRVVRMAAGGDEPVGELLLPAEPVHLRALLRRGGARSPRVTLRLTGTRPVRRRIDLPAATEENLGEVLGFELDRLTPFRRADVYLAWRTVGRDRAAKRVTVELEVAPRRLVDEAIATARGLGLEPERVELPPDVDGGQPLDLLPPTPVSAAARWHTKLNLALAALVVGLATTLVLDDLEREQAVALELSARVAAAREQADAALELERTVQALRDARDHVVVRRNARPLVAVLLDETARLLPDHTYLLEAHLRDGRLELTGYSAAVSELVEAFSTSPLFTDVGFLAPVTRDARENLDRFSLSLTLGERRRGDLQAEARRGRS